MLKTNFDIKLYNPIYTDKQIEIEKDQIACLLILDDSRSKSCFEWLISEILKFFKDQSVLFIIYVHKEKELYLDFFEQVEIEEDSIDIILITEHFLESELPSLFASCQIFISLLESESQLNFIFKAMAMNNQIMCSRARISQLESFGFNSNLFLSYQKNELKQSFEDIKNKKFHDSSRQALLRLIKSNENKIISPQVPKWQQALKFLKNGKLHEAKKLSMELINSKEDLGITSYVVCQEIFDKTGEVELAKRLADDIQRSINNIDPTLIPCGTYNQNVSRANKIYTNAFRRSFEFIVNSNITGDVYEFGTYTGFSARIMSNMIKEFNLCSKLYLFDSFQGLPEVNEGDLASYNAKGWEEGVMILPKNIEKRIYTCLTDIISENQLFIHKGYYSDTLSEFETDTKAIILNIDCDLYSSALEVLNFFLENHLLQDGTILLFDDYNCNRANPEMGERRALREAFSVQSQYSYQHFFNYGWHGQAFIVNECLNN